MKQQSKNFTVKQPWALGAFFICSGIAFLVMLICATDDKLYVRLLVASVLAVPTWTVALYYYSWKVAFDRKRIVCRVFFFTREYSYGEIISVSEHHSSKPSRMLKIEFVDGRCISIPSYCSNYNRAKQTLMKHVSIKVADLY